MIKKNITIKENQDKWLTKENKKLSPMVQQMLDKEMKKCK